MIPTQETTYWCKVIKFENIKRHVVKVYENPKSLSYLNILSGVSYKLIFLMLFELEITLYGTHSTIYIQ